MEDFKKYRLEIENSFPEFKKFAKKNDLEFISLFLTSGLNDIDKRIRKVEMSAELKSGAYYQNFEPEILGIKSKFEIGESVSEHLTERGLINRDFLLRDLGISHLHLKVGRTNELLLVYLEDNVAYFVDVATHEELFTLGFRQMTKFLEIVDKNWPDVLSPFIMPRLSPPCKTRDFTDDEKAGLLASGGMVIFNVNGKAMIPPGGGPTTDGSYLKAFELASELRAAIFKSGN